MFCEVKMHQLPNFEAQAQNENSKQPSHISVISFGEEDFIFRNREEWYTANICTSSPKKKINNNKIMYIYF